MMVGDDEVEAEAARGFSGGKGANARINADDELDSSRGGLLNDIVLHAVAVTNAMGDVEISGAAEEFDHCLEDDNGGGAVNVIVAVNEDVFLAGNGVFPTKDGGRHAEHVIRRVHLIPGWVQKMTRL